MTDQKNLAYGFTNLTERKELLVIKRFIGPGALQRWQTEKQVLSILQGRFPVPQMVQPEIAGEIHTTWVEGSHAQDELHTENAGEVLRVLGELLKKIQSMDTTPFMDLISGQGSVLVHGDFGPQNLILNLNLTPLAMCDWEWAHLGEPVEDAAWTEWIVRTHFPAFTTEMDRFYQGYGDTPPWKDRYESMIMQCQRYLEFARMIGKKKIIDEWKGRLRNTRRFQAS